MYEVITLTHANKKKPLKLVAGTIVGFEWSEAVKANVVYSAGGVLFPVVESLDEIEGLLKALNQGEKSE